MTLHPIFGSFATFEQKFLGGILTYKIGSKTKKHKFIRCADSDSFVESLNILIAKHSTRRAKVTEFNRLAFDEYPRDSWVNHLADMCIIELRLSGSERAMGKVFKT